MPEIHGNHPILRLCQDSLKKKKNSLLYKQVLCLAKYRRNVALSLKVEFNETSKTM